MSVDLGKLKIHDWDLQRVDPIPQEGEENACLVSFRLANVVGQEVFLAAWDSIKTNIVPLENFNAISLTMGLCKVAVDIYSALKSAKQSQSR